MTNIFNYIDRPSPIHRLTGATKLVALLLWSFAAMLTYDPRMLAFLALLSLIVFRISKIRIKDVSFVLGFTLVFIAMGALAGTVGSFFKGHQTLVNLISGIVVIFFGLHFLGVLKLNLFRGVSASLQGRELGFFSALLFGIIFSVGWTPCVGAFLGSALMLASQQGQVLIGVGMLLCYSLGLGIPFVLSAVLIDRLKGAFDFIKRNYNVINLLCGGLLILVGILMMTGLLGRFLTLLS